MGKGKKSGKGAAKETLTNVVSRDDQMSSDFPELQKRNVVQEEGSDSEEEKNGLALSKADSTKSDLRGSDSEEDNAAAGREVGLETMQRQAKSASKPLSNLSTKRKNKAIPNASSPSQVTSSNSLTSPALFQPTHQQMNASLLNNQTMNNQSLHHHHPMTNQPLHHQQNQPAGTQSHVCNSRSHVIEMNSQQYNDNKMMHESLGRIVIRLLPYEYQPELLPDGRYAVSAAAIGYLAQKLGH